MSMTQANIDAGAAALRIYEQSGKTPAGMLRPWNILPNSTKKKWRERAQVVLEAASEGVIK